MPGKVSITLELEGYLSWYAPNQEREITLQVPIGTSVIEAVRLAQLPHGEVAFAAIDGEQVELDAPVKEGARILLIPPISGG